MTPRYSLARRKARELLATAKVGGPPINVEKLAAHVSAVVRFEPFDGEMSGMVHRRPDGRAIIGVNSTHMGPRQRFTIAHEIGHLLLHRDARLHVDLRYPLYRDARSSTAEFVTEIEANQFAAELLMPTAMLMQDVDALSFDFESDASIERLAKKYDVSTQAMTIRISSLKRK